jgi:hypothetical protein
LLLPLAVGLNLLSSWQREGRPLGGRVASSVFIRYRVGGATPAAKGCEGPVSAAGAGGR